MRSSDPEYLSLLAAVLDEPGDDLPRLVMADWLDEHGESERAEFIRIQCELAPFPNASDTPQPGHMTPASRWVELRERERELGGPAEPGEIRPNFWEWFGKHMPSGDPFYTGHTISRGFVSEVRCTLADWCGGPCARCAHVADHYPPETYQAQMFASCPTCHGTGRIPGAGPRIVREHPVTRVVITDRNPETYPDEMTETTQYQWFESREPRISVDDRRLPPELFRLCCGTYPTVELAHAALSAACLSWAKAQPVAGERDLHSLITDQQFLNAAFTAVGA
jgi:uncharacterized protein (TIGR02996 family)